MILQDDANETAVVTPVKATVRYDTDPPDPPEEIEVGYGEGMLNVSWEVADPDYPEDWAHFHVMCWNGTGAPADDPGAEEGPEPAPDLEPDASTDPDADMDSLDADSWDEDASEDAAEAPADTALDTTADPVAEPVEGCPAGGFEQGDEFDISYSCSGRLGSTTRSYDLTGLENEVPYKVSVAAVDELGNVSEVGEVVCGTPSVVDDFWEVYRGAGGGDQGKFCFVATAAWGHPDHPAVRSLRAFRDEVLLGLPGGRAAVDAYYDSSPPAARWLSSRPVARAAARAALWPVAIAASLWVEAAGDPSGALLLLVVMAAISIRVLPSLRWRFPGPGGPTGESGQGGQESGRP